MGSKVWGRTNGANHVAMIGGKGAEGGFVRGGGGWNGVVFIVGVWMGVEDELGPAN